ncbi:META domain-containing protein [Aliiroseovarius sp. KMU-50]|uniref:META domain-containing protein n=1 Tax=Aliiroseovarius salicola TaxID=3009082 RepID=A0ABT4VY65_9RHOB|nr:META domain-containing protein [Aliiroseovarius sp. KMU-50]MDA5093200.1 META domain-containing protein [Aliiroseovarius sp. KMU-50]
MKQLTAFCAITLALFGCKDETLSGYSPEKTTWVWQELDGKAAPARATLRLPAPGRIEGKAPCNNYSARQSAPYPWFAVDQITATRMACPDLAAETEFFAALQAMSLAEVSADHLLLSNDDGREMLFAAAR